MSRFARRPILLAGSLILAMLVLLKFGPVLALLIIALGIGAAMAVSVRPFRKRRPAEPTLWQPRVQHVELPPPPEDPVVGWTPPPVETFATPVPPLADIPLSAATRGQLDGYALGRAKRIVEAPSLPQHAAADAESWPEVERTIQQALELVQSRRGELAPDGRPRLVEALVHCAAQGILLAEWRQLEDGPTVWDGPIPRVRASDVFTIPRIAEVMQRRLLPDLFAGIQRRPVGLELGWLVPYTIGMAFYLRLRGQPPKAFAGVN